MDDDVYAYEQEMEDEWEAMHAHEMEAAEEAMREMDASSSSSSRSAPKPAVPAPAADVAMDQAEERAPTAADASESAIDAQILRAQQRLQNVLDRCATLVGDDSDAAIVADLAPHQPRAAAGAASAAAAAPVGAKAKALEAATASFLLSRPPVDVDSLPVVLDGGKRLFLRKKAAEADAGASRVASSLALVPIQELMERIERVCVLHQEIFS